MAGGEPLIPAPLGAAASSHHPHLPPPAPPPAPSLTPQPDQARLSESIGDLSGSLLSIRTEARSASNKAGGGGAGSGGKGGFRATLGLGGVARRTLGILLLLVTVFLWTASNFLASYIFSDHTYDKPFFVVYINTSMFALSLLPVLLQHGRRHGFSHLRADLREMLWVDRRRGGGGGASSSRLKTPEDADEYRRVDGRADEVEDRRTSVEGGVTGGLDDDDDAQRRLLEVDDDAVLDGLERDGGPDGLDRVGLGRAGSVDGSDDGDGVAKEAKLSLRETAWLSLEFCMLWFFANYLASACLGYTSVGSVTILTSTSSVWTLVFCALMRVEGFTLRKLIGVLASLAGIVLISSVDLSGSSDENRGNFPHKSQVQIMIGDGMAFVSAIIYGLYVTVMKLRVGNEDRVNMPLFFGLVGFFNVVFLWPGFILLHYTGVETFEMPPTGKVWLIIMLNSISSLISDMAWAYAMLLTTPLVVTVGLSMTIPLSLIGEMIQYAQYSSWLYWIGAGIVFVSFLFINHESHEEEGPKNEGLSRSATEVV